MAVWIGVEKIALVTVWIASTHGEGSPSGSWVVCLSEDDADSTDDLLAPSTGQTSSFFMSWREKSNIDNAQIRWRLSGNILATKSPGARCVREV